MTYDSNVPSSLKSTQQWFGSIIGRPIDKTNRMNPISPTGQPMEIEAAETIAPSPTLRPDQRIQIYNQQYWWRLLNILHEAFPFVTRLLGYEEFNQRIAFPYLVKYPPHHWLLFTLGDRLPLWAHEEYHEKDRELIICAAEIDWAFCHSFVAEQLPPLSLENLPNPESLEHILSQTLYAQPHLHLLQLPIDGFKLRGELTQHPPEYWLEHPRPNIESSGPHFYTLYRNGHHDISWKEIAAGEYRLLKLFQAGISIDQVVEWLETQEVELQESAAENLQVWFQEWTSRGWLSLAHPHKDVQ